MGGGEWMTDWAAFELVHAVDNTIWYRNENDDN